MEQSQTSVEFKTGQAAESRSALIKKFRQLGFFEAYHESVFRCFRKDKQGRNQEVSITIYDAGRDVPPDLRYTCVARTPDGLTATGKPSRFADIAVENVQWTDLDR